MRIDKIKTVKLHNFVKENDIKSINSSQLREKHFGSILKNDNFNNLIRKTLDNYDVYSSKKQILKHFKNINVKIQKIKNGYMIMSNDLENILEIKLK